MDAIKVYVQVDSNNVVIAINSNIFIQDLTGWTNVAEGTGDKYAHAQSMYLDKNIIDNTGNYNYKLVGTTITALTDAEKATLFPAETPTPSDSDRLTALENALMMII